MVVVVGCERSGTHLLGRFFGEQTIWENHLGFLHALSYARGHDKENLELCFKHIYRIRNEYGEDVVLKWHPLLFAWRELREEFPEVKLIGIHRRVEAVVHSMMNHAGVMNDVIHYGHAYPIPNKYLGAESREYFYCPPEAKCAWKWMAAEVELAMIASYQSRRNANFYKDVDYSKLVNQPDLQAEELSEFTGLETETPVLWPSRVTRWVNQMPEHTRKIIREAIEGEIKSDGSLFHEE